MKSIKFLLLATGILLLCQNLQAAVNLTITPSAVSNTYNGKITLAVTGISSGGTVVIQKFLDANTNGAIGAGDYLVQQFNMTDGQASVFHDGSAAVTNFNVPGDTDATAGQITAQINFQNGDFSQNVVGKYLYKVSSSSGSFTNTLTVTNFPYAQSFAGGVFSNNTATVVSNAIVILFQPTSDGNVHPVGGAVANNAGSYTIKVPPGTYLLAAVRSNYLANLGTAPTITLGSGSMVATNLTLTNATQNISGKFVDANTSTIGLPGLLVPAESTTNSFLAVGFSDTNGNFTVGTRPDIWKIESDSSGLIVHGYLGLQNSIKTNTAGGSVSGITNALSKSTAIFYGSVKDNLGNPLFGIDVNASDDGNQYSSDGYSDANGNYVVGVSATNWNVNVSSDSSPTNYDFTQGFDTALTNGQAQRVNFTAILATNYISGNVQFNGTNVVGVGVSANANINSVNYSASTDTDTNGNYFLNVANGSWDISVNCNGGNDSLQNILGNANYQCPDDQFPNISGNNSTNNFVVPSCNAVQITTSSPLPENQAGTFYDIFLQASSCSGNFTWSVNDPQDLPPNLTLETSGELHGTLTTPGTYNFTVQVTDGNNNVTNQLFTQVVDPNPNPPPPLNIAPVGGGQTIVFFPPSGTNYTLQTTTNLATGPWVPASNGVQVIALTFSNTAPAAFFRLH